MNNNIIFLHKNLEIRISEGKGRGVFATEDIPANTIILKEKPLYNKTSKGNYYKDVLRIIRLALNTNREEFLNLAPATFEEIKYPISKKGFAKRYDKYLKNTTLNTAKLYFEKYAINVFAFKQDSAFLFYGAKFNHSCEPNVEYFCKRNKGCFIFRTIKAIKKDEEVFDYYIDTELPREKRQKKLLNGFGFLCTCSRCKKN
jgi:SET domain-containing protein